MVVFPGFKAPSHFLVLSFVSYIGFILGVAATPLLVVGAAELVELLLVSC